MWKSMSVAIVLVAMCFVVAPAVQAAPVEPLPAGYDLPTGDHGFTLYVRNDLEDGGVVPLYFGASEVDIDTLNVVSQGDGNRAWGDGPFDMVVGGPDDIGWFMTSVDFGGNPIILNYTTPTLVAFGGNVAAGTSDLEVFYGNALINNDFGPGTVVYVDAIPEPGTLAILLSGLLGSVTLLWNRRR